MNKRTQQRLSVVAATWLIVAQIFIGTWIRIEVLPAEYEPAFWTSAFVLFVGDLAIIMLTLFNWIDEA